MNILITGSSGFIGTNLITRLKRNLKDRIFNDIRGYDLKFGLDIFDDELESEIKYADIIYHLAALTSVEQSFKNKQDYYRTNVLGTTRIAELCLRFKKKLIYPSSAAVYYPDLSPYADSKFVAEHILSKFFGAFPLVILRLFNVFGPGMNKDTGSIMYNFSTSPEIVIYGDGEQTRDYIHVSDVVDIMVDAQKKKWNGKIVEVGNGVAWSTNYIGALFAFYRNLQITYKTPRREIKWSKADTFMLKELYKKPLNTDMDGLIKQLCIPQ